VSKSYYVNGYDLGPDIADLGRYNDRELSKHYKDFQQFMNSAVLHHKVYTKKHQDFSRGPASDHGKSVTYVKRSGGRNILNERDVLQIVQHNLQANSMVDQECNDGSGLEIVQLENMTFSDQIKLFQRTSVLIAIWGTAAHNVVFLTPGSSLILLVHPNFCDWAWIYANQAIFSGIFTYVLCDEPLRSIYGTHQFGWTLKGWLEAPFYSRDDDLKEVHIPTMDRFISNAIWSTKNYCKEEGTTCTGVERISEVAYFPYVVAESIPAIRNDLLFHSTSRNGRVWAHLMPAASSNVTSMTSYAELKFTALITTSFHPQALLAMYPELSVCVSVLHSSGLHPQEVSRMCIDQSSTGIHATWFNYKDRHPGDFLAVTWLENGITGTN